MVLIHLKRNGGLSKSLAYPARETHQGGITGLSVMQVYQMSSAVVEVSWRGQSKTVVSDMLENSPFVVRWYS